jgi:hypothetical protein
VKDRGKRKTSQKARIDNKVTTTGSSTTKNRGWSPRLADEKPYYFFSRQEFSKFPILLVASCFILLVTPEYIPLSLVSENPPLEQKLV